MGLFGWTLKFAPVMAHVGNQKKKKKKSVVCVCGGKDNIRLQKYQK